MSAEFESFGCPEYYVTDVNYEDAGGGNVRMFCYARKGGVDVPVYSTVMPSALLILRVDKARLAAERSLLNAHTSLMAGWGATAH